MSAMKEVRADGDPNASKKEGGGFNAWWEDRSLAQKILVGIGFAILGIGFVALLGLVVMLLWNWLMPDIFGLKRLNYWQAWGLLVLCWILFKSWGSNNRSSERKRKRELRRYIREGRNTGNERSPEG